MNEFEELARRSADSVRDATGALPVTDLGDRPTGGPAILGGLAVATLLVIVGVFAWSALNDRTADTEIGPRGDGDVVDRVNPDFDPAFRLEWPDAGMDVVGASPLPADDRSTEARTWLYENGDVDLLITAARSGEESVSSEGEEIEFRDGVRYVDRSLDDVALVAVGFSLDGVEIVVGSRVMTESELIDIAEALSVSGMTVDAPAGFELIAEVPDFPFRLYAGGSWVLVYGTEQEDGGSVSVTAHPADEDDLEMLRYLFADPAATSAVTVRGRDAWTVERQASPLVVGPQLFWLESGWLVQVLVSDGIDPVDVANSLVDIDLARWDELEQLASGYQRRPEPGDTVLTGGELQLDGERLTWSISVDDSGSLCFSSFHEGGSSRGCGIMAVGAAPIALATTASSSQPEALRVWGSVSALVERVALRRPDGSETELELVDASEHGLGAVFGHWEVLAAGSAPSDHVVAGFDAGGTLVAEVSLDDFRDPPVVTLAPEPQLTLASGADLGVDWEVTANELEVCLEVRSNGEGQGTCSADLALLTEQMGEAAVLGGRVPSCVVAVEFAPTGERGTASGNPIVSVTPTGGWGIVVGAAELTGAPRTYLLDVDGDVVATLIGRGETVSC